MPNEVEIRITATDLSGPAFASAMSKLAALKAAADAAASDRQMSFGIGNALAEVAALKAAMDKLTFGRVDTSLLGASLMALKSKLQSLGIADLADINVQPGRLMTQLQLIKRLIDQTGISDVLDFNLTPADLAAQLSKLGELQYDIPVKFDLSHMPDLGKIGTEVYDIPVRFDISKIPTFGATEPIITIPANIDVKNILRAGETMPILDVPSNLDVRNILKAGEVMPILEVPANLDIRNIPTVGETIDIPVKIDTKDLGTGILALESAAKAESGLAMATQSFGEYSAQASDEFSPLLKNILNLAANAGDGEKYMSLLGASLVDIIPHVGVLSDMLVNHLVPNIHAAALTTGQLISVIGGGTLAGLIGAGVAFGKLNDNISQGIPVWKSGTGIFAGLSGHIVTFGGAIASILPDSLILQDLLGANVSGWHLLADGIIETVATLGPAIVGIAAFAAGAVDSVDEIYNHFVNMDKVIDMTGQNVYPLTGAFSRMNQAVQPEVYTLLGEGLEIVSHNAGALQSVATSTGKVIDDLGARFTYAMDNGNGFNTFIKNSASDLAGWGDLVGNIGGILGNVFKVLPGYAQILLSTADSLTHTIEAITGSGFGEDVLKIGLAFHGAAVYVGLLGTGAAVLISKTLPVLANGILGVGIAVDKMGMDEAAVAIGDFAAGVEGAAALPWGWISLAAAGIGVLVYNLLNAKSAAQQFASAVQNTITSTKLSDLGSTLSNDIENYSSALAQATSQTTKLQAASAHVQLVDVGKSVQEVVVYSGATYTAMQNVQDYGAALKQVQNDQAIYNGNLAQASKVFGSNQAALAALTNAGITSGQMLTTNKQQMAENIIEAEGYNDALKALTGGTGRYAAAMNALSGPEQYLGDMLKSIQSVTQAQDNLMTVVTEGETSFDTFGLGIATINSNFAGTSKAAATASHSLGDIKSSATLAGAAMGGTSQASLTLAQSFYSEVNNAQQVIDALEQQEASTKSITTATATLSAQMLPYAGNNDAARATIVAMINDALGPGTVSLQNLNTWVNKNSTSMQGLASIMADSTAKAGTLANVLQTQLNSQFQADLLQSSGATAQMKIFTDAIVNTGNASTTTADARAKLISDLVSTGMTASDAAGYVDGLQAKIDTMHGKTIPVNVDSTQAINAIVSVMNAMQDINSKTVDLYVNTYNAVYGPNAAANSVYGSNGNLTYATGGLIGGSGGPTSDNQLIWTSPNEYVQSAAAVSYYGVPMMEAINAKKFSIGGLVGPSGITKPAVRTSSAWGSSHPGLVSQFNVALQIQGNGQTAFDRFMLEWMRNTVRVKGAGDVQKAFGRNN